MHGKSNKTVKAAPAPDNDPTIWERIKAHKVAQWTLAYAAAAYTLLHGAQMMSESFDWPHIVIRIVTVALILGTPLVATLAWFHGHRGRRRAGGAELAILTVLLVIAGSVLWYVARSHHEEPAHSATAALVSTKPAEFKPPQHSIAVLPFADMSEKKDQEYFADGMAEEILNLLVKIPELKVIGRTSSFQFKGKADDLRRVGAALGTRYVVEGSVRRSGEHVRVTAQLIDARDGAHRWSETYDRDVSDVLKVQSDIAAGLVRALQLEVAPSILMNTRRPPRSIEVYDSYLRGRHAWDRFDQQGYEEAVADFQHALDLDPAFLPAAEALTDVLCYEVSWGFVPPKLGWERVRASAEATLKLDPHSAHAHSDLGDVHLEYDWDWPAAQRELQIAFALAPHDSRVLEVLAMERTAIGQWSETLPILHSAIAVDPLDANMYQHFWVVYLRLGRFVEAENAARRTLEIAPTYAWGHYSLGIALLMQNKTAAALAEMQKETEQGAQATGFAVVYHALHRTQEANAALALLESERAEDMASSIAEVYAFRGQVDRAIQWLDRAFAQKDFILYYIKGEPLLQNIKAEPRYKAFLRKMNLPE